MAGTVQADFLQPQSAYGLTIQTPSGNTIATINSAGIFSNTGVQILTYTGNVTGNLISTGSATVSSLITSNINTGSSSNLALGAANSTYLTVTNNGLVSIGYQTPYSAFFIYSSYGATGAYSNTASMTPLATIFNSASGVNGLPSGITYQTRSGDQTGWNFNTGAVAGSGGSTGSFVFQTETSSAGYMENARMNSDGTTFFGDFGTSSYPSGYFGALTQFYTNNGSGRNNAINLAMGPNAAVNGTALNIWMQSNNPTANSGSHVYFYDGIAGSRVLRGSIYTNGSSTTYATSSDRRLKANIVSISANTSGQYIDSFLPRAYDWIETGKSAFGFVADEYQQTLSSAVKGQPNATKDIGNIVDSTGNILETNVPQPARLQENTTWTKTGTENEYQQLDPASADQIALIVAELQYLRKRMANAESTIVTLQSRLASANIA